MSDTTLSVDEAFNPDGLKSITSDGQTLKLWTVGGDTIENDAYINGQYGWRRQPLTLEEEYDGPSGIGTYAFNSTLTQPPNSDRVDVTLKLTAPFTENGNREDVEFESVEVFNDE